MTISINDENINYTLEDEHDAGDILKGLTSWLEESGLLIGGLEINHESMPLNETEWKSIPIESIDNISIEALSLREGRVRQLETARDFFILLETAIKTGDEESLKELYEGFRDLKGILPHLLNEGPHPTILPHLEKVFEKGFKGTSSVSAAEAVQMASVLESRRRETASPESEARSSAKTLAEMAESLDDVAVQLQTGQDKTAMETIIRLTEILQMFMRSLSWLDGSDSVEEIMNDMNRVLSELEEALKEGDTVLIGDLLEYEIKPRLIKLPSGMNFSGGNG
ncbi:MAG: hypothetical protein DRZ90_13100 [Spirochaetes bacterium]|nr:MAG: hypothetical protein DRZ90_13100 [Spirochaetota bacterium]